MPFAPPTERDLDDRIDRLKHSPGTFQRLVETFLRQEFPQRAARLIPIGRTVSDVTVKGWPDAETRLTDGTIHAFEATHSDAWKRHVEEDAQKLRALDGGVESYLLVAWSKTPSREDEAQYRALVAASGVPAANVRFIFRNEFVNLLSNPRHARIWMEHLELRVATEPFALIRSVHTLFGTKKHRDSFMPTREEFAAVGVVHRPAVATAVEKELGTRGWSIVFGKGASGKTVMATSIALGPTYADQTVYYLDLAAAQDDDVRWRAVDIIATRGEQGVLFMVDNVHRDRVCARKIFDYWLGANDGSRLIMLSRFTSFISLRGEGDSLADLSESAILLEPAEEDFAGVYRRIAQRLTERKKVPEPPLEVLTEWARLFGGDLLAFSAAVASRAHALSRHEWHLTPRDAEEYLARTYLDDRPAEDVAVLERLAVLALLEIPAPASAFRHRIPRLALDQGLVLRSEHGRERHARFRLVHPGMGDLLLGVMPNARPLQVMHDIASDDPQVGVLLASRLHAAGRDDDARHVMTAFASASGRYSPAYSPMLVPTTIQLLVELGMLTPEAIHSHLSGFVDNLVADAVVTRRGYLIRFLTFIKSHVPEVIRGLETALGNDATRYRFMRSLLESLPGEIARCLEWAKREFPAVYRAILADFGRPEFRDDIAACLLNTQLGETLMFIDYVGKRDLRLLALATEALLTPESLAAAANAALRTEHKAVGEYIMWLHETGGDAVLQFGAAFHDRGMIEALLRRRGAIMRLVSAIHQCIPDLYRSCAELLGEQSAGQITNVLGKRSASENSELIQWLHDNDEALFARVLAALTRPDVLEQLMSWAVDARELLDLLQRVDPVAATHLADALLSSESISAVRARLARSSAVEMAAFLQSVALSRSATASLADSVRECVLARFTAITTDEDVSQLLSILHAHEPGLYADCIERISEPDNIASTVSAIARGAHSFGASLLRFVQVREQPLCKRFVAALVAAGTLDTLAGSLLRVHPGAQRQSIADATTFLDLLWPIDSAAAILLANALLAEEHAEALCGRVSRSPFSEIAKFLGIVATARPPASLAPRVRGWLLAKVVATTDDDGISAFLRAAAEYDADLYAACIAELSKPASVTAISSAIARGACVLGTSLLQFANASEKALCRQLVAKLTTNESASMLAISLPQFRIGSVVSFLETLVDCAFDQLKLFDASLAASGLVTNLLHDPSRHPRTEIVRLLDVMQRFGPQLVAATREACNDPTFVAAFVEAAAAHPGELVTLTRLARDRAISLEGVLSERLRTSTILESGEIPVNDVIALLQLPEELQDRISLGEALLSSYAPRLCDEPIDHATTLLRLMLEQMPDVFRRIRTVLSSDAAIKGFQATARVAPPEHLVAFLRFAREHLPALYAPVNMSLDEPSACSMVIAKATRGSLDSLTAFLAFAREHFPRAWEDIAGSVEKHIVSWAELGTRGPQASLSTFFHFLSRLPPEDPFTQKEILQRVAAAFDAKRWVKEHENDGYLFPAIVRALGQAGRHDIIQPVARAAVLKPNLVFWRWGLQLHAFAAVIRSGEPFLLEETQEFFRTVARPAWLSNQYWIANPPLLANALFDLWCHLDPSQTRRLAIPVLRTRFVEVWREGRHDSGAALLDRIKLTGTVALIGLAYLPRIRVWDAILDEAACRVAGPVGKFQLQFWCGIRYLASVPGRPPRLDRTVLQEAYEQFAAAPPSQYARINALTAETTEWLRNEIARTA